MIELFNDRSDAGQQLASALRKLELAQPIVFALPRGGVPVGFEIARALQAPLDVVLVRKIGAPMQRELAIGAVADGHPPYVMLDRNLIAMLGVPETYVEQEQARQIDEIARRRVVYGVAAPLDLRGRDAIVVDDGIATGATVHVALMALRKRHPARIVLAVPVAPRDSLTQLQGEVDHVVCLKVPEYFPGVGGFYRDFTQVEDSVVIELLERARRKTI